LATALGTSIEAWRPAEPPAWPAIRAAARNPIPICRSFEVRSRTEVSFFIILALPLRSTRGWDQLRYGAQCGSLAALAVNWGTSLANFSSTGHSQRHDPRFIGEAILSEAPTGSVAATEPWTRVNPKCPRICACVPRRLTGALRSYQRSGMEMFPM